MWTIDFILHERERETQNMKQVEISILRVVARQMAMICCEKTNSPPNCVAGSPKVRKLWPERYIRCKVN